MWLILWGVSIGTKRFSTEQLWHFIGWHFQMSKHMPLYSMQLPWKINSLKGYFLFSHSSLCFSYTFSHLPLISLSLFLPLGFSFLILLLTVFFPILPPAFSFLFISHLVSLLSLYLPLSFYSLPLSSTWFLSLFLSLPLGFFLLTLSVSLPLSFYLAPSFHFYLSMHLLTADIRLK